MSIKEKDIKILWSRAAGRCAFPGCRRRLTEDKQHASEAFPLGEQAHIVAEEPNGPRGQSILTTEERNSYGNLVLLCPTHHTLIDKNADDFPVEKLHLIKRDHELFIEQTTATPADVRAIAANTVYANLVDQAVEKCELGTWKNWTSRILMSVNARWPVRLERSIESFREAVVAAVWPGTLPELERALTTFSVLIYDALRVFCEHSVEQDDELVAERFYKIGPWDAVRYHELLEEYESWVKRCDDALIEATKAANWLADVVRRNVNPLFFAAEGKFLAMLPSGLGGYRIELLEYRSDETVKLPDGLVPRKKY